MAKRRRLETPTAPLKTVPTPRAAPPPIAQVTGEAATVAAAQNALGEVERARAEGRLVITLLLEDVAIDHLVRDRMAAGDEDMDALKESIRAHGQRTPIEVVEAASPKGSAVNSKGYGLISGWRRLAALKALYKETGEERFGRVKALIRAPQDAGDAYVAMVEENEIRVGLSYYERARIAVMAAEREAFASTEDALSALYASASRAKRSKIRSFVTLHEALGDHLQFPAAIPERLGLQLVAALKDGKGAVLKKALKTKAASPEAEAALLARALSAPRKALALPTKEKLAADVTMETKGKGKGRRVTLSGAGLTDAKIERLRKLLKG